MHETGTETEVRAAFARESARLPTRDDFEQKVRQRIRARQRAHRTKMFTVSALGAVLAVAAGVVIARGGDNSNVVNTQGSPSSVSVQPSAVTAQQLAAADVTELAAPPSNVIPGFKLFATERGLVLWGIRDPSSGQVTAARYSAQDDKWTTLAFPAMSRPPSESATDVSVVSTGTELLVLGRENLALDLSTGKWRPLAEMPSPSPTTAFAFWTGKEAVVIGASTAPAGTQFVGQAFDPSANRWRTIAAPPEKIRLMNTGLTAGSVLWTGEEALVFGIRDDGSAAATVLFFVYDPTTDQWRVAPSPLDGRFPPEAGATDGRTAYWVYNLTVAAGMNLDTEKRIEVPPVVRQTGAESRLVLVGGQLATLGGSTLVVFDAATNQWISGPAVPGNTAVVDGRSLYVVERSNPNSRLTRVQPAE